MNAVLFVPKVPLLGPVPPRWFADKCDGCTMSPDGIPGIVDWRDACILHDWHYSAYCNVSRCRADYLLMRNMLCCGAPLRLAVWYWGGTTAGGWRKYCKFDEGLGN